MAYAAVVLLLLLECAVLAKLYSSYRNFRLRRRPLFVALLTILSVVPVTLCVVEAATSTLSMASMGIALCAAGLALIGVKSATSAADAPGAEPSISESDVLGLSDSSIRTITEIAPIYVALHDRETRIEFISRTRTGCAPSEMIGVAASDEVAAADRDRYRRAFQKVWDSKTTTDLEYLSPDPKLGRPVWYHTHLAPIVRNGATVKIVSFTLEVDARKRHEVALKSLVHSTPGTPGSDFFSPLVKSLASALGVPFAIIAETDPSDSTVVHTVACWGNGALMGNFQYRIAGSPCSAVLAEDMCRYSRSVSTLFPSDRVLSGWGIESFLGVRLNDSHGSAIGVLFAMDASERAWSADDESILSLFAARASVELERSRAEEELRRARNFVQRIADASPHTIFVFDRQHRRFSYLSPRFETELGIPVEVAIESGPELLARLMHPDDLGQLDALLNRWDGVPDDHVVESEYRIRGGEGSWLWFVTRTTVFSRDHQGEVREVIGTAQDITSRKRIETTLMESERQKSLMLSNLPGMVYRCVNEPSWPIVFASEGCIELTGYTPEEFQGNVLGFNDLIVAEDRDAVWRDVQYAIEHRAPYQLTYRIRDKGGKLKWCWERGQAVFGEDDVLRFLEGFITDVTERRMAYDALALSEQRFRTAVDYSPIGMTLVSPEGRYLEVNRALCEITGYGPDELVTKTFQEITHADDLEADLEYVRQMLQGEIVTYQMDKRYIHKTGRIVWIQLNVSLVRDSSGSPLYFISQIQDVTERKHAVEALRASEERLELALRGADLGMWDWNLETGEITVNDRWSTMLGYVPGELREGIETWSSHIHPEDLERVAAAYVGHLKGASPAYECEYRVRSKSGAWVWILDRGRVTSRSGDGRALRVSGTHLDITDRKHTEAERHQLEQQIQHAQKLESLGVLAGGIAHDFNNLLVAILGNADLALTDLEISSPARHSVKEIEVAARRAADLCRQMLAYAGKGRFEVRSVNLREVVEEMAQMLDVSISKKITLKYNFAERIPDIEADPAQMRQVIMNLIINASEAIGDRSGVISIGLSGVECDAQYLSETYLNEELPPGLYAALEVADTGCGMSDETKRRLFEPFFSTKFTGRGLGMAAVLGIVRGHRGAIKVYSELGKGTTFKILFPSSSTAAEPASATWEDHSEFKANGTVLLIDDEETVRAVGKRMLERLGFTVLLAQDGEEGIRAYQLHRDRVVCVLLDLTMPKMDGEECFRELRKIQPDVRVVISSGYNEQEVTQRFIGKGLAGFIQKPYQLAALKDIIRKTLWPA